MKSILAPTSLLITAFLTDAAYAADSMQPATSGRASLMGSQFTQTDGSALYQAVCQGCHMPNGTGAQGAAAYPALAKDVRLAAKGYPVAMVLNGSKAMPPFKSMLSDEQIAAVVTYVRTHFGNAYKDKVSVDDVKTLRK